MKRRPRRCRDFDTSIKQGSPFDTMLQPNDSAARGDRYGLGPMIGPQLDHDVLEMHLDCFLGDEQLLWDLPIPASRREVGFPLQFSSLSVSSICGVRLRLLGRPRAAAKLMRSFSVTAI